MLYFIVLLFLVSSHFYPAEKPASFETNECPISIDETLKYLAPNQYSGCKYPKSKVYIEDTIYKIPRYCFYGVVLRELILNNHVEIIEEGAFAESDVKINFERATNLRIIEEGSFYQAITTDTIIFPPFLETIGSYAFCNVTSLKRADIKAKYIQKRAFFGCINLRSETIEILGSGQISDEAFRDCYQLKGTLKINEASDRDENGQIIYTTIGLSSFENSGIERLNFSPLEEIGSRCFFNCKGLISCNSFEVNQIKESAFEGCTNFLIEHVNFRKIESKAFEGCHFINDKMPKQAKDIQENAVLNSNLITGSCGSSLNYEIDKLTCEVTISGTGQMTNYFLFVDSPFYKNNKYVKYVFVGDGVTSIGEYSFNHCTNLVSIDLPESLLSIERNSFQSCWELQSINIPESVTFLGFDSFYGCSSLEYVIINGNLSTISDNSFCYCNSLSYFLYKGVTEPTFANNIFDNTYSLSYVTVTYNYELINDSFGIKPIEILPPQGIQEETGKCNDDITYIYNFDSSLLKITGSGELLDSSMFKKIKFLAKSAVIEGNITIIGNSIFYYFKNLVSIKLPSSITTIGSGAFQECSSLTSIDISSVRFLGTNAFQNCTSLTSLKIPSGITSIQDYLLYHCEAISSIYIPNTVRSIGMSAFSHCYNLSSIIIPDSVKKIGISAFSCCINILTINIPDSVKAIGMSAFSYCHKLSTINIPNSIQDIDSLVFLYCYNLSTINIPNSVQGIGLSTFSDCYSLSTINIPDSVKEISLSAFAFCYNLSTINISDSVQTIGARAFQYCTSLKSFKIPSGITLIQDSLLYHCESISSIYIPNTITSIGSSAFSCCFSLSSINIPDSVIQIGATIFANCTNLININLSKNIRSIEDGAFQRCISLTSINISEKVILIDNFAFEGCISLSSVLYKGYKDPTIAKNIFEGCCKLKNIDVHEYYESELLCGIPITKIKLGTPLSKEGQCGDNSTYTIDLMTRLLTITGTGSLFNYNMTQLSPFTENTIFIETVIIDDNITNIGEYAFYNCTSLKTINLSNNINNIGKYAFYGCESLITITIPIKIRNIYDNSFSYCSKLSSIIILGNLTSIRRNAFYSCSVLSYIFYQGYNEPFIFTGCFSECDSLESVDVMDYYKSEQFDSITVRRVTSESVTIEGTCGTNLSYILNPITGCLTISGNGSMYNYTWSYSPFKANIVQVNIEEGVTTIGDFAFLRCKGLSTVNIPTSITSIGEYSFYECKSLSTLTLPKIESIGYNAFRLCISLRSVLFLNDVNYFGSCAFAESTSLSYIIYQGLKVTPNNEVFFGCRKLKSSEVNYNYNSDTFHEIPIVKRNIPTDKTEDIIEYSRNLIYIYNFTTNALTIKGTGDIPESSKYKTIFQDYKYILQSIQIDENITAIGSYSFYRFPKLETVIIEGNLNRIGSSAFSSCSSLSSFLYKERLEPGYSTLSFERCDKLASIDVFYYYIYDTFCGLPVNPIIPANISEISGECGIGLTYKYNVTTYTLTITGTGDMSNYNYRNRTYNNIKYAVKYLNIEEGVTSIGQNAFQEFVSLISVNLSNSVTSIKSYAFERCRTLVSINISSIKYLGSSVFLLCSNLTFFEVPSGIRSIPNKLLFGCSSISSIYIPNTIISINEGAFANCQSLSTISIPESVVSIGSVVFYKCHNLSTISIPKSVTSIGSGSFEYCTSLKSVIINGNVTSINSDAFSYCYSLTNLLYKGKIQTTLKSGEFSESSQLKKVDVMYYYNYESYCGKPINRIIPEDVEEIRGKCGTNLEYTYNFNSSTLSIKGNGFMTNYTSKYSPFHDFKYILKHINIEGNVLSIGSFAFFNCSYLESVTIDSNLTDIFYSSFLDCSSLSSILYKGLEQPTIKPNSFNGCDKLTRVDVPYYYEGDKFGELNVRKPICNSNAPLGCFICDYDDPSQCTMCNVNEFFNKTVDSNGQCQCINNYELDENNYCVSKVGSCNKDVSDFGCSLCYLYDQSICVECDANRGFKTDPTTNNRCECINPDYNISQGECVELSVECDWGDKQPVTGCKLCNGVRPYQCTVCDEENNITINNEDHTCKCKYEGFELNEQGKCVLPSSNCDESEMIGCIKCTEGDAHQCIICDSSKGFVIKSDNSHKCTCEIEGYEVNKEGVCSPPSDTHCSSQVYGCLKCSENNNKQCLLCDPSFNFNKKPDETGLCTCATGFTMSVNGECFVYEEVDPTLSFTNYDEKKEIPNDYIDKNGTLLVIDTTGIGKDESILYNSDVSTEVTDVIVKNLEKNVQITIKDRKSTPLNIKLENNQLIQINMSNSDFPINFPSNSQNVSLLVDTVDTTLGVNSNEKEKSVNLGNVSVSKQSFVLNPKTNVIFEFVNLFGNSQISKTSNNEAESTSVTAKKVNLQQGSKSQISDIFISEELNLAPNSVLTLNKGVNFSQAVFTFFKTNTKNQRIDYSYIKFSQEVTQFPKKIHISQIGLKEFLSEEKDKVIIVHENSNLFGDEICKQWASHLDNTNGYEGLCVINDQFNNGHNSVYAYKGGLPIEEPDKSDPIEEPDKSDPIEEPSKSDPVEEPSKSDPVEEPNKSDPIEEPGESDPPKKGGLGLPIIIGIVVAAVVIVAVVIIVIIFVVKKKKKDRYGSLTGEILNNDGLTY